MEIKDQQAMTYEDNIGKVFFSFLLIQVFGSQGNSLFQVSGWKKKEKKKRMPGGSNDAVVTSLECRHQQKTLPGVKTPPPHSSLPPSTILYLCLQEEGGVMGHENAMGTVAWTLHSRKLKARFHQTLDRKLLGT